LKTLNEIPISILCKDKSVLLYFDMEEIQNANEVEKAYILLEIDEKHKQDKELEFCINSSVSKEEWETIFSPTTERKKRKVKEGQKIYIDVTENFHMFASGMIKNKGLTFKINGNHLIQCKLCINYIGEEITPNYREPVFYEKELILSSRKNFVVSPWILSKSCRTTSLYVKNISKHEIVVYLQNSPNAEDFVDVTEVLIVQPKETGVIVPHIFSKYIRITVKSKYRAIVAKLWFQTQMANVN